MTSDTAHVGLVHKRSVAIWIELLPVLAIPVLGIFGAFSAEWLAAATLPLFFVTGVGWALQRRWRLGLALGLLRFVVLIVSWATFFSELDFECGDHCESATIGGSLGFGGVIVTLLLVPPASAAILAWVTRRVSAAEEQLTTG